MIITTGRAPVNPPGQQLGAPRCRLTRWRPVELHFCCCTIATRFPLGCGRFSGRPSKKPNQLFLQPVDGVADAQTPHTHTLFTLQPPRLRSHYTYSNIHICSQDRALSTTLHELLLGLKPPNIWILSFSVPLQHSKCFLSARFIHCSIFFHSKS